MKSRTKSMTKLGLVVAVATLALAACSGGTPTSSESSTSASSAQSPTPVTIGLTYVPDVQFSPLYVAEEEGYFADEGLDVTLRHHGAQESLFGALQSGEEDVVFAGASEMMQARSTGVDIVNWATLYQNYPIVLIVPSDSEIQSSADLNGKTVGLPGPFGDNYYTLLAMQDRLDLPDMKVEYIGYTQSAALADGSVDAVIGFINNDFVTMQNAGLDVRSVPILDELPLVSTGLGSLGNNIDETTYAKVLTAMEKAVQTSLDDPDLALDATQTYVPSLTDPTQRKNAGDVLDETLKLYVGGDAFGQQNPDTWEKMSTFLEDAGILEKPVPATDAYTTAVLDARTNG